MDDSDKTVFISYRRKLNPWPARAIFGDLVTSGYDVFMDVESIDSGDFESIIINQIAARAHFLVVLTPGSLEQTKRPGDWLRREVEHAIELERNIVPVMVGGFDFGIEAKKFLWGQFPGQLEKLRKFNGVNVHDDYFVDGMRRLRDRFLKRVAITPAPQSELSEVKRKIEKTANSSPDRSILNQLGLVASGLSKFFYANQSSSQPLAFTLAAPTLSSKWGSLEWTTVLEATDYVLEMSGDEFFSEVYEAYKGHKTEYSHAFDSVFLRVKAENNALNLESPWSNVIRV